MRPLPPGSTIGILGGGQLGRMLAVAAAQLGLRCHIYSDTTGPAFDVAAQSTVAPYDDLDAIAAFAGSVDVVTLEFENVPLETAATCAASTCVRPGPKALEVSQDRLAEKTFIASLGLPVAPFHKVDSLADLEAAIAAIGAPAILKTRRLGYDGKGQARITSTSDASTALQSISSAPAVLEGHVEFESELSVLLVRGADGATQVYDLPLNTHRDGILHTSCVPAGLPAAVCARAKEMAATIAEALDYVGVLAVEMFNAPQDEQRPLVINEIAPRVHNSGHWTLDACAVSQFENHIRAVAGWPLAPTTRHSDATMTNIIGPEADDWQQFASSPGAALHLYGKNQARPGRKMGHITQITARSADKDA